MRTIMCALLHKSFYFSESFIDPFRRFFLYKAYVRAVFLRGGRINSAIKAEADKP